MKPTVLFVLPPDGSASSVIPTLAEYFGQQQENNSGAAYKVVTDLEARKPVILAAPDTFFLVMLGQMGDRYLFRLCAPQMSHIFPGEFKVAQGIMIRSSSGLWPQAVIHSTSCQLHSWFTKMGTGQTDPWGKKPSAREKQSTISPHGFVRHSGVRLKSEPLGYGHQRVCSMAT